MTSNNRYTITSAEQRDIHKMVDLLQQLFSIEADFDLDPAKQEQGLALLLESESAEIFVVRDVNAEVIAMATLQSVISTAEGGMVGWLEDVVVDADYRGRGIGESLLSHVGRWAQSRQLKRLQLVADRDNRLALDFYTRHGWQETNLNLLRWVNSC